MYQKSKLRILSHCVCLICPLVYASTFRFCFVLLTIWLPSVRSLRSMLRVYKLTGPEDFLMRARSMTNGQISQCPRRTARVFGRSVSTVL